MTDPAQPEPAVGVTGRDDPVGEAPWAMQLMVRLERDAPPTRTAVCEAAARAVVALLADPRSADPDGPWHGPVTRWTDGRIRKVVRRARGTKWEQSGSVAHVLVEHAGAEVRAYVPGATDAVPPVVARQQVAGIDVPEDGTPSPSTPETVRIAVTPHVPMSTGKAAAQCGHAAQLAWLAMSPARREAWQAAGFPVSVTHPDAGAWTVLSATAPVRVTDAGFTEVPAGTDTTVATWQP
ncbi:MAG: peptidyl-tRNA hydrolase [Mycobacteriales bacterium]